MKHAYLYKTTQFNRAEGGDKFCFLQEGPIYATGMPPVSFSNLMFKFVHFVRLKITVFRSCCSVVSTLHPM